LEEKMDNLNKIDSVPPVEALVKEAIAVQPAAVEHKAPASESPKPTPTSSESVVLYATKDIITESGASASKGYSRVSKKDAEQLLQYSKVRVASKEEIETYFNK
jgi:hypothetical protein